MKKYLFVCCIFCAFGCSKKTTPLTPPPAGHFSITSIKVNDNVPNRDNDFYEVNINVNIKISFSAPVDHSSLASNISLVNSSGTNVPVNISYSKKDSVAEIQASSALQYLSKYVFTISKGLESNQQASLSAGNQVNLITEIDTTDKFQRVSDSALLDIVQKQTFKYFWDFGHPVSGMARERNTSGDIVTTGGTGFGVMSIIAAINRNFVSRSEGFARIDTIVNFLKNKCTRYHGAFSHWINGASGATIPFSAKDNGADLVETSFLMQGLLCARQYFNSTDAAETTLRNNINDLWNGIEWNWFRNGSQNVLYWHWSPDYNFDMNMQIKGWNEAMIVYVLAASSNT